MTLKKVHLVLAVLITGGDIDDEDDVIKYSTVEVLTANGSSWCSLPNLPDIRQDHSQSGLLACGGWHRDTGKSCLTFNNGRWNLTHKLHYKRYSLSSWSSAIGVILISSPYHTAMGPTELLTMDGLSQKYFPLKHISK